MSSFRIERINGLLQIAIGTVVSNELNDPAIASMISVTQVSSAGELSNAKVYVSIVGDPDEKKRTLKALNAASGYIHKLLRPRLNMKRVPRPQFILDESIERGADMSALIDRVIDQDTAHSDSSISNGQLGKR